MLINLKTESEMLIFLLHFHFFLPSQSHFFLLISTNSGSNEAPKHINTPLYIFFFGISCAVDNLKKAAHWDFFFSFPLLYTGHTVMIECVSLDQ